MFSFLTNVGLEPGTSAFWIAFALLAALIAAGAFWRHASAQATALARSLEATRLKLAGAEQRVAEATRLEADLDEERRRRAEAENVSAAQEARLEEREKALAEMKARLDAEFKATTADLLKGAHESFLERAKETFDLYKQTASSEGERRRKALDDLLKPVSDTLVRYEKGLAQMREEQAKAQGALTGQLGELARQTHDVRAEAQKLATALRAGPKARGRWGEEQLRNVVEIAGMAAYVDFVEQSSHSDGDARKQPDMIVNLPGERCIIVDSKVSLGAYLDATEAETEEARVAALGRHADDLWNHVKTLAAKDYAAAVKSAHDYVVMFVPGESYVAAAIEARPALYQDAVNRKVLIATPTSLIVILKSAALNWRQEKMTESAQIVAGLAKDLYDSLGTLAGHVRKVGGSLESAVKNYNAAVGSLEGRVLSRARKFAEYELPGIEMDIAEPPLVEGAVREMREASDLRLEFDADEKKDDAA